MRSNENVFQSFPGDYPSDVSEKSIVLFEFFLEGECLDVYSVLDNGYGKVSSLVQYRLRLLGMNGDMVELTPIVREEVLLVVVREYFLYAPEVWNVRKVVGGIPVMEVDDVRLEVYHLIEELPVPHFVVSAVVLRMNSYNLESMLR